MSRYLSKSDFKIAQTCPTKLYYKKQGYPSTKTGDAYLELLADGGYMVEKIARLLFADGRELPFNPNADAAAAETLAALAAEQVTLYEATVVSDGKLARIDVLVKRGNHFDLYEVKARAFDSAANAAELAAGRPSLFHNRRGGIKPAWRAYLEDVTFQTAVLQEKFPEATVTPYLIMPDRSQTTRIDNLHRAFTLLRQELRPGFADVQVAFHGDVEALRQDHFLTMVDVTAEVNELTPMVVERTAVYQQSLTPLTRLETPISLHCRTCEYRLPEDATPNGFYECWGELARPEPHILDMYHAESIGGRKQPLVNQLIAAGKTSLFDIPEEALANKNGQIGARARRQRLQLRHTRRNSEWVSDELGPLLRSYAYPLQFIDFETSALAIPYHAGMHPYETVAFQWSCHVVPEPGAAPVHFEWINVDEAFPNFNFARALMETLSLDGTIFIWAPHENTVLRTIYQQMVQYEHKDSALANWLQTVAKHDRDDDGLLVDMNRLTLAHYFHPLMGGRTSIKLVSDAVWQTNATLRARYPAYVKEENGRLLSPYQSLPKFEIDGEETAVKEGTGAVRAYQAMVYGNPNMSAAEKERWRRLLLQYCELDTLSMVMIWEHWQSITASEQ